MESALHALATLGFVRATHGVGFFVTGPRDQTALLNYVWRVASAHELSIVRATIDERAAPMVASRVHTGSRMRLPRTLDDINLLVHERSLHRLEDPRSFVEADIAFHRSIVASLRGMEIGPTLYERIGMRLMDALMMVADVQADDTDLEVGHLSLATAILDGDVGAAARRARYVALEELRSLSTTLG
jgi:DNA-binding FadR family transcriptional regulator